MRISQCSGESICFGRVFLSVSQVICRKNRIECFSSITRDQKRWGWFLVCLWWAENLVEIASKNVAAIARGTVRKTNRFCQIKKLGAHTMVQILDICLYFKRTWTDYKTGTERVAIRSHVRFLLVNFERKSKKREGAVSLEPTLSRSGSGYHVSSATLTSC